MYDENEKVVETTELTPVEEVAETEEFTPVVEESSGLGTLLWGAAKIAALAGGAAFTVTKVSQKVYANKCEKKGDAIPEREKFYQFWRPKAKKHPRIVSEQEVIEPDDDKSDD